VRLAYPEFENVGSAPRKLLALAFVVAGVSGIAPFIAESRLDPDSMNAMALAPVKSSVTSAMPAATTETQAAETTLLKPLRLTEANPTCQENTTEHLEAGCTQRTAHKPRSVPAANEQRAAAATSIAQGKQPGLLKPPEANPGCRENKTEHLGADCTQGTVHKPRSVPAASEQRATAAPAIAHGQLPALLVPKSASPSAAIPNSHDEAAKPVDTERSNDSAPASAVVESPMPSTSAKNARTRSSYIQPHVRNAYSPSRRYGYQNYQRGYAGVW